MKRRSFLKKAGAGLAAASVAAPAIAQQAGLPTVNWRMAASWPKALDTLYGGAELICRRVGEATGGKFNIKLFAAGEIMSGNILTSGYLGGFGLTIGTVFGRIAGKEAAAVALAA